MQVAGEEKKKLHVMLDGIVVLLTGDIDSADKKHTDGGAAFTKAVKEAEGSKVVLDADKLAGPDTGPMDSRTHSRQSRSRLRAQSRAKIEHP